MTYVTYDAARRALIASAQARGWRLSAQLKVPHATSPDGQMRLWFRPRAVYFTRGAYHSSRDARTLCYFFDPRRDGPTEMWRLVSIRMDP